MDSASRTTGSASLRVRTVTLAARSDAPRTRGRGLGLRGASLVGLYRIAPSASGIATKTWACATKSERSARSSKRIAASVSACSRSSDRIATNGERCAARSERCPTRTEPCLTRTERRVPQCVSHHDARAATRCAKVAMRYPFLAVHRSLLPMHYPFRAMRDPYLPMLHPFLPMLHAFAATRYEGEDAIREESRGHHARHGVPDRSRERGSAHVGCSEEHVATRPARVGMPRELQKSAASYFPHVGRMPAFGLRQKPRGQARTVPPHARQHGCDAFDWCGTSILRRLAVSGEERIEVLGGVAEWFKAPVLKTGEGASLPWVRIPPPPLSSRCQYSGGAA